MTKLNAYLAREAAQQANKLFGQWMPERWLNLFIESYNDMAASRVAPAMAMVEALREAERFMAYFSGETGNVFVGPGTPQSCLEQIREALSPTIARVTPATVGGEARECDCGAVSEGKWAGIHHPSCPALLSPDENEIIERALARHMAVKPSPTIASEKECGKLNRSELAALLARKFPEAFTPYGNGKDCNALAGNVAKFVLDTLAPPAASLIAKGEGES